MWATQSLKLREGQRVVSGVGYSSMGCSIPYAIGSSYASDLKDNQVICINGDGGFQMNMQELMFISQNKLNIKIVVINNSGLGLIKATQDKYMDSKYYGTSKSYANCVDLKLLAKSYEIDFLRIDSSSDLENIGTLLEKKGPCLIECKVSFYSNLHYKVLVL